MRRVFIALSLPKEICEKIGDIIKELSRQKFPVRWVGYEGCHITVHFLGDQDERAIENIKDILLRIVPKYRQTTARLDKLDYFPSEREPRVIHLSLLEDRNELINLQKELGEELKKNGFRIDERKWQPHITLGRAKGTINAAKWEDVAIHKMTFAINKVELIESKLTPDGTKYSILIENSFA